MFLKKCKCGANEKNFIYDIGEFYVDDCCEEAGFDCFGNKVTVECDDEECECTEPCKDCTCKVIEEPVKIEEITLPVEPEVKPPVEVKSKGGRPKGYSPKKK